MDDLLHSLNIKIQNGERRAKRYMESPDIASRHFYQTQIPTRQKTQSHRLRVLPSIANSNPFAKLNAIKLQKMKHIEEMSRLAAECNSPISSVFKEKKIMIVILEFLRNMFKDLESMQTIIKFIDKFIFVSIDEASMIIESIMKHFDLKNSSSLTYKEMFSSIENILVANNNEIAQLKDDNHLLFQKHEEEMKEKERINKYLLKKVSTKEEVDARKKIDGQIKKERFDLIRECLGAKLLLSEFQKRNAFLIQDNAVLKRSEEDKVNTINFLTVQKEYSAQVLRENSLLIESLKSSQVYHDSSQIYHDSSHQSKDSELLKKIDKRLKELLLLSERSLLRFKSGQDADRSIEEARFGFQGVRADSRPKGYDLISKDAKLVYQNSPFSGITPRRSRKKTRVDESSKSLFRKRQDLEAQISTALTEPDQLDLVDSDEIVDPGIFFDEFPGKFAQKSIGSDNTWTVTMIFKAFMLGLSELQAMIQ